MASTVSSSVSSTKQTISKVSPSKIAANATKPIHSTYRATQRILSPRRYTDRIFMYLAKMKRSLIVYGVMGIASLMIVNQASYMGLIYMIRHRYDEDKEFTLLGMDMVWIYKWLNIPYHGSDHDQKEQKDGAIDDDDDDNESVRDGHLLEERQIQDYNINADIKLAKMAYNGLLYPRIGAAVFMTFAIGTPLLRIMMLFK